ncbi:Maf family protein [Indiicoccus explosivorum]|uniref:Maf family protein n=1 Tax=Indiicoccus explosivorum TaxID=1917864 RepID=UPI000B4542A3|nr:nucleoside triphosphate pyrophosphatase [Indiicoccus explosivorum]
MNFTTDHHLILASASPRRSGLLGTLGVPFDIIPSAEEEPEPSGFRRPLDYVIAAAEHKARDVSKRFPGAVVIGADTIVVYEGEILRKPEDAEQARANLQRLSGETHEVITGVCILHGKKEIPFTVRTEVTFRELPPEWIDSYVQTEDPYDKAGGYGIQSDAKIFIDSIHGDYFNVVGLPVGRLAYLLGSYGFIRMEGKGTIG